MQESAKMFCREFRKFPDDYKKNFEIEPSLKIMGKRLDILFQYTIWKTPGVPEPFWIITNSYDDDDTGCENTLGEQDI